MTVTANILQRTFRMRHAEQSGTCFTLDVEGRRYLVTARHLVGTIGLCGIVEIQHSGKWMPVAVQLVGHGEGDLDVSVLAPQYLFGASHVLGLTAAQLQLAEGKQNRVRDGFPFVSWAGSIIWHILKGTISCPSAPSYGFLDTRIGWWLRVDLNHRPRHYECRALTN